MLTNLIIQDVVLIEKLSLDLRDGLNVFTGETGAGKSILLDALGLALGDRGDAGLVRHGADQACVSAAFDVSGDHPAYALAAEQSLTLGTPFILRRVLGKDGKSRAFIDDQAISIGLLKRFGETLLEIHGQFDTHGLLNAATHRGLLDEYANLGKQRAEVAVAFTEWRKAEDVRDKATAERERAEAEEHFLRSAVQELDDISPEADEPDQLAARRTQLQHREKISEALDAAEQALNHDRSGAIAALAQAGKAIARIADKGVGLPELLAAVDRASEETATASQLLDRAMANLDAEPDTLQHIEERLFALRAIARKHQVAVEALPELRRDLAAKLAVLNDQGDQISQLTKKAAAARQGYIQRAEKLSEQRRAAATKLETAITRELPPLKFERAKFVVDSTRLDEGQWSADGIDRVGFLATINPGSPAGALGKIASGGELSRFMLALKVVLARGGVATTLVFDEIDAGIGGATASAVGERLARLADDVQILVVTHSPQVAARGSHHLRVMKQSKAKQTTTDVVILDAAARREEIARMLAGSAVTDAARQAAQSLLDDAGRTSPKRKIKKAG